MNTKATYIGALKDGVVSCPQTGREFPFKRGEAVNIPFELAVALEYQQAEDWKMADDVTRAAKDKRESEKKAAEAAAKQSQPPPTPEPEPAQTETE